MQKCLLLDEGQIDFHANLNNNQDLNLCPEKFIYSILFTNKQLDFGFSDSAPRWAISFLYTRKCSVFYILCILSL